MSAYYDLYETPVPEGEEPKSLHARVYVNKMVFTLISIKPHR